MPTAAASPVPAPASTTRRSDSLLVKNPYSAQVDAISSKSGSGAGATALRSLDRGVRATAGPTTRSMPYLDDAAYRRARRRGIAMKWSARIGGTGHRPTPYKDTAFERPLSSPAAVPPFKRKCEMAAAGAAALPCWSWEGRTHGFGLWSSGGRGPAVLGRYPVVRPTGRGLVQYQIVNLARTTLRHVDPQVREQRAGTNQ